MRLNRIWAVVLRQYYLLSGSLMRFLSIFVWIVIDMILWGYMSKYLTGVTGQNFVPILLGAVLLWDFFTRVMHGVTMAFLEDVWARNFLNLFASPLWISEYLIGLLITGVSTSLVGLVLMLVLATTVFGLSFFTYGLMLIPFLLTLLLFGMALGIVGCCILLRFGPSAEWCIWPIPAILSPFAGVFYPLSTLPGWMQVIGHGLPPSHVFEGMRTLAAGQALPLASLGWAVGLALLYTVLASMLFSRVYAYAASSGLLARFSAEGVN